MGKEKYLEQVKVLVNGSPYYQLLGIEIVKMRKGRATLQLRFRKELTHALGRMHGGAIASLADSAVAMALITLVDPSDRITTIEFKINFCGARGHGEVDGAGQNPSPGRENRRRRCGGPQREREVGGEGDGHV